MGKFKARWAEIGELTEALVEHRELTLREYRRALRELGLRPTEIQSLCHLARTRLGV